MGKQSRGDTGAGKKSRRGDDTEELGGDHTEGLASSAASPVGDAAGPEGEGGSDGASGTHGDPRPLVVGSASVDALMNALVDRLLGGAPHFTPDQIAGAANVDRSVTRRLWRAMGLADVPDEEVAFTDVDLQALERAKVLLGDGEIDLGLILQLTRILGLATARIAGSVVDFSVDRLIGEHATPEVEGAGPERPVERRTGPERPVERRTGPERPVERGTEPVPDLSLVSRLLGELDALVVYLVHRHLVDAASRRLSTITEGASARTLAVGFADLVGFTSMSQELADHEIVELVERFEALTSNEVVGAGGRIIKMIGDEVMFAASEAAGPEIALRLAETFTDPELPSVRVGLASGSVVERSGDLFGPVVNLAARATSVANPGTVVVAGGMRDRMADDERYQLRRLRPRRLKGLGFVELGVVRRGEAAP